MDGYRGRADSPPIFGDEKAESHGHMLLCGMWILSCSAFWWPQNIGQIAHGKNPNR